MVQIRCDNCDQTIQVENPIIGQKVKCPHCGDVNVMRSAAGAPAAAQAARPDRAAEAGKPPANGPEVDVMSVRPAMFRARPWRFLLLSGLLLGGLVGGAILGFVTPPAIACLAVAVLAGAFLLGWRLTKLGEGIRITTKRTIDREGFFSKQTSEVLHADIRNIQVKQTFGQRLLRVGTIAISCAAEHEDEVQMDDVPDPENVRRIIDLYRPL